MKPTDLMPFGKHKGLPLKDVPRDYADWLCTKADGFKERSPGLYAFFMTGADLPDPAKPKEDEAVNRLAQEILGAAPQGFAGWWHTAYGKLKGEPMYIPHLRVAIAAWDACANQFYAKEEAARVLNTPAKPVTVEDF